MFLTYYFNADPRVRGSYEQAASAAGVSMDLLFVNRAGHGSKVYRALMAELRGPDGRYLPALMRRYPPPRALSAYTDGIVLCSFSAGYGASATILGNPIDAAIVSAVVGIDSWHAGFDADGTASDADLAPLLAYALRAKEGAEVCWVGHSDVPTPQTGPEAFASTTQVATELLRLAGGAYGGLRTLAHNVAQNPTVEHSLALTQWGPGWLASALQEAAARRQGFAPRTASDEPTMPQTALGVRALQIAREEQLAGIREEPGGRHSPRIQQYFDGCERNGIKVVGRYLPDETPWCAAGLSWCLAQAAVPGEGLPYRRRLSVREVWADAIASGTARSASAVRAGLYEPQVGDAWIGVRGGYAAGSESNPFGPSQGRGHTGRVAQVLDGGRFVTLDANINNKWSDVNRDLAAPELVGFVAHPPAPAPVTAEEQLPPPEAWAPTADDVAALRRLWELSDAARAGHDGMDAFDDIGGAA